MRRSAIRTRIAPVLASLALSSMAAAAEDFDPPWASVPPSEVIKLNYDSGLSPLQNGNVLHDAAEGLQAGQRLELSDGTWNVTQYFNISVQGTAQKPIWITAQAGARPVITRNNAQGNVLNIGSLSEGPTSYLALQGLEITGGSIGIRFHSVSEVWLDRCHIHHTDHGGITVNTQNAGNLHITRNEINDTSVDPAGTGEGMYLGSNGGATWLRNSVIALNHVYNCGGTQGDGIELKQGSYNNRIIGNVVHDTNYPCILVYGTDGQAKNVIERNICWNSNDNTMQVQGEADVFNNLLMSAGASGFYSRDHQGETRNLRVEQNTIITTGRGASLVDWGDREGMFLINNAIYSANNDAVRFSSGADGVVMSRNVVRGPVIGTSLSTFTFGVGLSDFEDVSWDGTRRLAVPRAGSVLVNYGNPFFANAHGIETDVNGQVRTPNPDVGAFEQGSYGLHYGNGLAGAQGKTPLASISAAPVLGTSSLEARIQSALLGSVAIVMIGLDSWEIPLMGGSVLVNPFLVKTTVVDSYGRATYPSPIPNNPLFAGMDIFYQWGVLDPFAPQGVAFTDGLQVTLTAP